jgi:hypothetical protein
MGYSFYLISRNKDIKKEDYKKALDNLSEFNKQGLAGRMPCDVFLQDDGKYIRVSGSFGVSGKYAEGFVLNLLMILLDLGYKPRVLSRDWKYGTDEDFQWLELFA